MGVRSVYIPCVDTTGEETTATLMIVAARPFRVDRTTTCSHTGKSLQQHSQNSPTPTA
ncbi:hypothetical protein HSR122_1401 [Halapricum desulfuricans]|uniref:Uncharacterized protein n=1 Tax=Halapricum desulfuricans TaxID=2841257 RepID=A0A897N7W9_9EURY|nr:hypothetical protein HSR122_1401 [Halapricum desulfuricans]